MNKKGFTLIELLAVVVILALIMTIAVPRITSIIDNARIESYKSNDKVLVKAAKMYMATSYSGGSLAGSKIQLSLAELISNNYITPIKDPITKNDCDAFVEISQNIDGSYSYDPYINCSDNYITTNYSGNNVVLNNAKNAEVNNLFIYGNTLLSGTPSIDSPVTITSAGEGNVLGLTIVKENLWDRDEAYNQIYNDQPTYTSKVIKDGRNSIKTKMVDTPGVNFNIKYKVNTQYTIMTEYYYEYNPSYVGVGLVIEYTDGISSYGMMSSNARTNWYKQTIVTAENKTVKNIRFTYNADVVTYINFDYMAIYEGNVTGQPYLPYDVTNYNINLSHPLYSLADGTRDYIDFSRGKVVRNIGIANFDGSADENWGQDILVNGVRNYFSIDLGYGYGTSPISSNNFPFTVNGEGSKYSGSRYIELGILTTRLSADTVAGFKTWLTTHPTTVIYKLKTPYEENISLPIINTKWGFNRFTTKDIVAYDVSFDAMIRKY